MCTEMLKKINLDICIEKGGGYSPSSTKKKKKIGEKPLFLMGDLERTLSSHSNLLKYK